MRNRIKDFNYYSGKKYDGMMGRCYRESDRSFSRYGGRGIRVCGEWVKDIETFRMWLRAELHRLDVSESEFISKSTQLQLDRIDGDGHYSPSNCRLVSPQSNSRNKNGQLRAVMSAEGEIIKIA